jgi:hypothetical protein
VDCASKCQQHTPKVSVRETEQVTLIGSCSVSSGDALTPERALDVFTPLNDDCKRTILIFGYFLANVLAYTLTKKNFIN